MSDDIETRDEYESREDAGKGDANLVKLWLSALRAADDEEQAWRKEAEETVKRYRMEESSAASKPDDFNILYSNIETMVPALYNSVPVPDVRRRFGDRDEAAKYGAQIIERCTSYMVDSYDFDDVMDTAVRDNEITGRAVTRVRYKPYVRADKESGEEKVVWEEACCEHVPWANFRRGPGRVWKDVDWIAFELFYTREQLQELSKDGSKVTLDVTIVEDKDGAGAPPPDIFKRARVWEIWDKDKREVLFIAPSFKDRPLRVEPDPLELLDFFPVPRPLMAIRTSDTLVPVPPYRTFKKQAMELNRVTRRIMALIEVLKWRGIRDSSIKEFESLKNAEDGELVPMEDAQALYAQAGGLDKAIYMLPIDKLITVVRELSVHREEIKQVIFEITGIADIMRGQTDPRETKGAQQIKTQWGSLRIQRRQQEVARYARDLFRLKSEIISNKFQEDTLLMMSGVQLPTKQEKAQAQAMQQMMMMQQQAQQRPQPGGAQPMPPPPNGAQRPPVAQQGAF